MERQEDLAFEIFERADYGVVLVDQDHHVQLWNQWMEELTNLPASDVLASPLNLAISAPVFPDKIIDAVNEVFENDQTTPFASHDESTYFFEAKPIKLSDKTFCLLQVFDTTPRHDDQTISIEELKFQHSQELAITTHLLNKISGMNKFTLPGFSFWQKEKDAGNFSGDIVLSAPRPSGGVNILVGDFVGRGLPAAVGALPVAEVFYGMTEKGFGLSDIIEEVNKKLLYVLPEGLFCAACMIELEDQGKMLAVWNGGLPDLLVVDHQSNIKHRVASAHIPLGINSANKIDLETVFVEVSEGDKVVCFTDGVINAKNDKRMAFGTQQVEQLLKQGKSIADIQQTLLEHIGDAEQLDDISLAELDISPIQTFEAASSTDLKQVCLPPARWSMEFDFSAQVLRSVDIVPLLVNALMHIQAPHEHRQRIYTVLAEICSNALEHGVLGLQSAMKQSANGFAEYYALRTSRLVELDHAYIKVSLNHQPIVGGGVLTIRVEDSGKGFDYQQHAKNLDENQSLCGRGEALLQKLCSSYEYSGKGNIIQADYQWME